MNDTDVSQLATEPNPLVVALHAQIQLVASRPIDMRMLTELEKTCLLARELIVIGKQPDAMQKHNLISGNNIGVYSAIGGYANYATPSFMGEQAVSAPQETFGVTAIREIVSALSAFMPKPYEPPPLPEPRLNLGEVMTAINAAKEAGETELESQLREALVAELGRSAPLLPEPTIPALVEESQEAAE